MSPDQHIQPLTDPKDISDAARIMVSSEPWITLELSTDTALSLLTDPTKEVHASRDDQGVTGFVVLDMRGLLRGYIQILCVRADCRGQGLGSTLIRWAENRILQESPNVFICVSSFNTGARRLYERLGFEPVGALREFIVNGHDEILLRKTRGTWADFASQRGRLAGGRQ